MDRNYQTKRERLEKRLKGLVEERQPWDATNRDIVDYFMPGADRFMPEDRNRGGREDLQVIDDTAIDSLLTLASGLQTGLANPGEKWLALRTEDPELQKFHAARDWLDQVVNIALDKIARGNTYATLFGHYEHLGAVGTSCSFIGDAKDPRSVIHHYPMGIGQYCLAEDEEGRVDTCYREFSMSVRQIVRRWGYENCSDRTQRAYDNHEVDRHIRIVHAVEPREMRDPRKQDAKSMPWMSCYFEPGVDTDRILSESGFELFPVLAPRWSRRVGDVYGYGPGRRALGAVKQLQQEQFAKAVFIDQKVDPALQGPNALKGNEIERNPGGYTPHDATGTNSGVRKLYETDLDGNYLLEDIADVRQRIRRAYFTDMFLMLTQAGAANTRMTAEEVRERHAEKLLLLGPLVTSLYEELLRPLVENLLRRLFRAGMLPPAPQELAGKELGIDFVSPLAMAQKAMGTYASDRFVAGLQVVASLGKTEVLDRLDADGWADAYHDMTGASPKILVPIERVAEIRAARVKAEQAQAQAAMLEQQSVTGKNLAAAGTSEPSLLTATGVA